MTVFLAKVDKYHLCILQVCTEVNQSFTWKNDDSLNHNCLVVTMIILHKIVLHYYTDLNLPSFCTDPGKKS